MPATRERRLTPMRGRTSAGVALLTVIGGALASGGCLSNEYSIKKDELRRIAAIDPEARGQSVRLSQQLGDRRSDAIDPAIPEPQVQVVDADVDLSLNGSFGGGGGSRPPAPGAGQVSPARGFTGNGNAPAWRATPPAGSGQSVSASSGGFHGTPSGGGFHGTPSGGFHAGGGGFHAAPAGGAGGGHIGLNFSGGGGGGNDLGAVLVVVAVVAIVAATVATISLAASEGVRFDGHAEMAPEQTVYLKNQSGTRPVALRDLTPADVAGADSALVMDDEGYGLRRLDHAPLDRKGGVFRFDLGAGAFTFGDARASGVSAHIQGGAFFTHSFGLLVDLGLGGGSLDPCCVGAFAPSGATLTRHSLGLEAEAIPLGLGPLHVGAFAGGGVAIAGAAGTYEDGPVASGGALLELDLTSRMAFSVRGGVSRAWLPSGPSSSGTITGGLAIY
jgi:hypothetical protein